MLHKSFKPAKCKTALKMSSSRIKLLRNKREVQLRQLKREVAQLLAAGQDRTAMIRVEHVVREEKTVAAYDLIEIYCELIVARLSMIESQKLCPVDLKEAVCSVAFASPRCADLPELADVKKHFTAKYGKEFVSSAVELRPNCGVSRLLVEKLSARAPNGPEKMKILSAIAEEHNVKWDPKPYEDDTKPPEDLLNGPGTFQPASMMHAQSNNVEPPNNFSNNQASSHGKHDAPSSQPSSHFHSPRDDDFGSSNGNPSGFSYPDPTPPGTGPGAVEYRHPHARSGNKFSSGSHQQWNMEFKDATAAAQAAAESAERASMAARAAAELSTRDNLNRRHSREDSHFASGFSPREDEGQHLTTGSRQQGERPPKDPVQNASKSNSPMNYQQQTFGTEEDDLAALNERFYNLKNRLAASSDSNDPPEVVSSPSMSNRQTVGRHSRTSSSESEKSDMSGDKNLKRAPGENEEDIIVDNMHGGSRPETLDYFRESNVHEQSSGLHTHSPSRIPSVDENSSSTWDHHRSSEDATSEDPFVIGQASSRVNAQETSSFDVATAVFDDYGSDDDEAYLHVENELKDHRSNMHSQFSSRTNAWSPEHTSMAESPRKSSSSSLFGLQRNPSSVASESLTSNAVPSQPDNSLPVTFDDSDGPSSENEDHDSISSHAHSRNTDFHHLNESSSLMGSSSLAENVGYNNRKTSLYRSSVDSREGQVQYQSNQGVEAGGLKADDGQFGHPNRPSISSAQSRSNSSDVNDKFQTPRLPPSTGDNDGDDESGSGSESGKELNFGVLAGGFRNKGYKHPPYLKNPGAQIPSPSKQAVEEDTSARNGLETSSQVPRQDASRRRTSSRTQVRTYDFNDRDSVEDPPLQQKFSNSEEGTHNNRNYRGVEVNKVSESRRTFFDSDDSDPGEEITKQKPAAGKTAAGQTFSRRTKAAAAAKTKTNSSSPSSENVDYAAATRQSPPTSKSKPLTFQVSSESKVSSGKDSVRPSGTKQASNPAAPTAPKMESSSNKDSRKASASAGDPPSREDSVNRASHVHPKLPDYDTFAAHLRSLRQDRQ